MDKKRKKILFIYSHTGIEHIVSVQAIEEHIGLLEPDGFEFKYLDFVRETSHLWSITEIGYTPMIKYAPFIWDLAYKVLSRIST